jgi:predicted DNA-binding transcriptional regulator YafY
LGPHKNYREQLKHLKGGRLQMNLQVADTREPLGWILSFGAAVQVISPPFLRQKVKEEARKVLENI